MLRRLFTVLSVLSLLLCVATCMLWVRSYDHVLHVEDMMMRTASGKSVVWPCQQPGTVKSSRRWTFESLPGRLYLYWSAIHSDPTQSVLHDPENGMGLSLRFRLLELPDGLQEQLRAIADAEQKVKDAAGWLGWGIAVAVSPDPAVGTMAGVHSTLIQVIVPHWMICLLTSLIPGLQLAVVIRRRVRRKVGLCPSCGYDLRASLERCPECGAGDMRGEDR